MIGLLDLDILPGSLIMSFIGDIYSDAIGPLKIFGHEYCPYDRLRVYYKEYISMYDTRTNEFIKVTYPYKIQERTKVDVLCGPEYIVTKNNSYIRVKINEAPRYIYALSYKIDHFPGIMGKVIMLNIVYGHPAIYVFALSKVRYLIYACESFKEILHDDLKKRIDNKEILGNHQLDSKGHYNYLIFYNHRSLENNTTNYIMSTEEY